MTVIVRIPQFDLPRPRLLDLYVARQYLRVFVLALVGLLGVFYISTFIDMADRVFRGSATTGLLLQYLYFETPRYAYLIIPMAALVATLVVVGSLTKNSELIVMRACGVSLYRSAVPLLLFALLLSGVLYEMQENVLAYSNRRADAILARHARLPRPDLRRAVPKLDHRAGGRHLPLRDLRPGAQPVRSPDALRARQADPGGWPR